MTRGNLLIVMVLILALVGMFFWTLNLQNRQAELLGAGGVSGPSASGDDENGARLDALEERVQNLTGLQQAARVELSRLAARVDRIEETGAALDRRIAGLAGGPTEVAAGGPPPAEGSLRAAIEDVLEERRQEDRKQRLKRMAEGMSRFLLADIEATEEQRTQFVQVVSTYLDERDRVRRKYAEPGSDAQSRDAELSALNEDRNAKLLRIFDATQFAKIEERLNRGRRFFDGRRGSPTGRDRGAPFGSRGR